MDNLAATYGSGDDADSGDDGSIPSYKRLGEKRGIITAPEVDVLEKRRVQLAPGGELKYNPSYEELWDPVTKATEAGLGSSVKDIMEREEILNRHKLKAVFNPSARNVVTGHVEGTNLSDAVFEQQRKDFSSGRAISDPSGHGTVAYRPGLFGDPTAGKRGAAGGADGGAGVTADATGSAPLDSAAEGEQNNVANAAPAGAPEPARQSKRKRRGGLEREGSRDPFAADFEGPWAKFKGQDEMVYNSGLSVEQRRILAEDRGKPLPEEEGDGEGEDEGEKQEDGDEDRDEMGDMVLEPEAKRKRGEPLGKETAVCYLKPHELKDYQGRSWVEPPRGMKTVVPECYKPKKCIKTWDNAHPKGVSRLAMFPETGHLFMSGGLDGDVKLWDFRTKRLMMHYQGHTKGVRDLCFNIDGHKFLSSGYDRQTRLWDVETGKVLGRYSNGKIPFCCRFNPNEEHREEFLVGQSDKKILQWDIRSDEVVQTYDQHLAAVNTITFIDDMKHFVTSSDDKTLRVWEWGIPVVTKYIADPAMHSMPSICRSPSGKWFLAQSMDNRILVYRARGRIGLNGKKSFKGHTSAGYACQVNMSPDGKYVISGDSSGSLWIWNWTGRVETVLRRAHRKVVIGCEWHPLETSKVLTCSWDGAIKLWD